MSKKQVNEASININGADASEVAEILRMMQLAGAPDAKVVGPDDITPKPMPKPGGCGMGKPEPEMGDMIRMISSEDQEDEYDDTPSEPDETYMNDVSDVIPSGNDLHREKDPRAIRVKDPAVTTESIKEKLWAALQEKKQAKPDYIDIDKDGNTEEPMKKAVKDKGIQAMIDAGNAKADAEADDDETKESVAGPDDCWDGYAPGAQSGVKTKAGTGKNKGRRVNNCEPIN